MAANFCGCPSHLRTYEALNVEFWAMIGSCAEGVDEEDVTNPIIERRQHLRQLLQLRRRRLLRLLKVSSFHITSSGDDDDLAVRKDCGVVVDMIGHVTNLGAGNGVNTHRRVVLHHSHNAVAEEEDALWSRRSVVVASVVVVAAALLPTGTLPISMGLIAVAAIKWLLPILHLESVLNASITRPCVEAVQMLRAQLHLRLSHPIQDALCPWVLT